jgi:hypothetical protein
MYSNIHMVYKKRKTNRTFIYNSIFGNNCTFLLNTNNKDTPPITLNILIRG